MKKRFIVLLAVVTLLLALTITSFAETCNDCGASCVYRRIGRSSTYTSTESCKHYLYGDDVIYYHYDYFCWTCYDCGYNFGYDALYIIEKIVCNGHELAP